LAEVAGGGQVRRAAVLVAAVPGDGHKRGRGLRDGLPVLRIQHQGEEPGVVLDVRAFPEASADDDRAHRRLVEDRPAGHVGHRDTVPPATEATARARPWNRSHPPAVSMKRWYFICDHVERSASVGGGRSSHRSVRKPPASVP
jgi:hypothetical protein